MFNISKRKEIIDFLSDSLDGKINKKNIEEIEKKYKEAQSFFKKETLFRLPTLIACFYIPFRFKDFSSYVGNTLVSIVNIGSISCGVLIVIRSLFMLYFLHRWKSKIKKYYQLKK